MKEQPGEYPYTRGISAEPRVWTMGQYGGFGTPAETNARFRQLLDQGLTGFSVALDLPTQLGLDSDHPLAAGEVGKVGVAIDSLRDIENQMDGIPLDKISQVRTTANSIGYIWAAMFIALAEQREVDPNAFGIFIQNDVLKEYIARGTQIFPAEAGLKLSVDVIEHIEYDKEAAFIENIVNCLTPDGVLITGTPNVTASSHASSRSQVQHINLKSIQSLRDLMKRYFENVFMFGQNDEVVHTGYAPMCHYIWAVAAGKKAR